MRCAIIRTQRNQKPQEPEPHRGIAEIYSLTGQSAQAATEKETAEKLAR